MTRTAQSRVTADAFARAMSAVDEPPTLVVLNACRSGAQIRGLLNAVPLAIGMADSVGDRDAMAFAARSYSAVAEGQSVEWSWRRARARVKPSDPAYAEAISQSNRLLWMNLAILALGGSYPPFQWSSEEQLADLRRASTHFAMLPATAYRSIAPVGLSSGPSAAQFCVIRTDQRCRARRT